MFCLSLYGGLFLTGVEAFELAQTPKTSCRSRRVVRDYHDDDYPRSAGAVRFRRLHGNYHRVSQSA